MGLLHFCASLVLLLAVSLTPAVCGNAELRALMEIKSHMDPDNTYLASWTSNGDPCGGAFEGVACNEHRKVANISLQGKGLSGVVSPALGELKCLSGLYLHYNSLTGEIPKELANLNELTDLYLNDNNLSGTIPPEIGDMASLQVLQLCYNQLTGSIPTNLGSLKKLTVLSVETNRLNGSIPSSLGTMGMLKRLYLGFNQLSGSIPAILAKIPQLEVLHVQNNILSGVVPPALKRLNGGLHCENNPGLCGVGFSSLRACTVWDDGNIIQGEPFNPTSNYSTPSGIPMRATFQGHCNQKHCSALSKLAKVSIVSGAIVVSITLMIVGFLVLFRYRRQKQKIGTMSDTSDGQLSTDQAKESYRTPTSPLVSLEYSKGWDLFSESRDGNNVSQDFPPGFMFNLIDVESATNHFSEVNLLGISKLSSVYKGILKDGSNVAIKSINVTCCKTEEAEFMKGLHLLASLRHDNLVKLRGFCLSKGRGECFLIYDFVSNGNLSRYLDVQGNSNLVLDWHTRVSIINGIAKGIGYLHCSAPGKPGIVHQNISIEKILINEQLDPLISDSGLPKLLADDAVFSALKVSAALGYMAPEYVTTGRFTEKSDVYAFGVIILQILSGKSKLGNLMQREAESCRLEDFIDQNLKGKFSGSEAAGLIEIALACTNDLPDQRPSMEAVIGDLRKV